MAEQVVSIYARKPVTLTFVVVDADGAAVDLTGLTPLLWGHLDSEDDDGENVIDGVEGTPNVDQTNFKGYCSFDVPAIEVTETATGTWQIEVPFTVDDNPLTDEEPLTVKRNRMYAAA